VKPLDPSPDPTPPADSPAGAERAAEVAGVFREHNRTLIGFLVSRLRNEQEAMEVAQEAYVKVLQLEPRHGAVSYLRSLNVPWPWPHRVDQTLGNFAAHRATVAFGSIDQFYLGRAAALDNARMSAQDAHVCVGRHRRGARLLLPKVEEICGVGGQLLIGHFSSTKGRKIADTQHARGWQIGRK
jgi:hypothetical protein